MLFLLNLLLLFQISSQGYNLGIERTSSTTLYYDVEQVGEGKQLLEFLESLKYRKFDLIAVDNNRLSIKSDCETESSLYDVCTVAQRKEINLLYNFDIDNEDSDIKYAHRMQEEWDNEEAQRIRADAEYARRLQEEWHRENLLQIDANEKYARTVQKKFHEAGGLRNNIAQHLVISDANNSSLSHNIQSYSYENHKYTEKTTNSFTNLLQSNHNQNKAFEETDSKHLVDENNSRFKFIPGVQKKWTSKQHIAFLKSLNQEDPIAGHVVLAPHDSSPFLKIDFNNEPSIHLESEMRLRNVFSSAIQPVPVNHVRYNLKIPNLAEVNSSLRNLFYGDKAGTVTIKLSRIDLICLMKCLRKEPFKRVEASRGILDNKGLENGYYYWIDEDDPNKIAQYTQSRSNTLNYSDSNRVANFADATLMQWLYNKWPYHAMRIANFANKPTPENFRCSINFVESNVLYSTNFPGRIICSILEDTDIKPYEWIHYCCLYGLTSINFPYDCFEHDYPQIRGVDSKSKLYNDHLSLGKDDLLFNGKLHNAQVTDSWFDDTQDYTTRNRYTQEKVKRVLVNRLEVNTTNQTLNQQLNSIVEKILSNDYFPWGSNASSSVSCVINAQPKVVKKSIKDFFVGSYKHYLRYEITPYRFLVGLASLKQFTISACSKQYLVMHEISGKIMGFANMYSCYEFVFHKIAKPQATANSQEAESETFDPVLQIIGRGKLNGATL